MAFEKIRHVGQELRAHSPFTILGAVMGILFMLFFRWWGRVEPHALFAIFHPLHVVLSAMVTASLFEIHRKARSFILILVVGYLGSIGIATLSDCLIPYLGESVLGVSVPSHAEIHEHEHEEEPATASLAQEDPEQTHGPKLHLGFIEEWWLVNPAAVLGVIIAYLLPATKYPHALHVLVSTWASSSHILMNTQAEWSATLLLGMLIVLFLAVWLPCCVSDIVFPLLFVKSDGAHLGRHGCILCGRRGRPEDAKAGRDDA